MDCYWDELKRESYNHEYSDEDDVYNYNNIY